MKFFNHFFLALTKLKLRRRKKIGEGGPLTPFFFCTNLLVRVKLGYPPNFRAEMLRIPAMVGVLGPSAWATCASPIATREWKTQPNRVLDSEKFFDEFQSSPF